MKRRSILLLAALCLYGIAQAQVGVYRSSGWGAVQKERKERPKREYEWTNTIIANYAMTLSGPSHNVGFTYARCKLAGFYVNAMVGIEWNFANAGSTDKHFVTNETSHPRISLGGGAVIRMVIPLYAYVGVGYAYKELNYKTVDGQWAKYSYDYERCIGHCANIEAGLMGNIKGFTILAGYSVFLNRAHEHEIKVGLGYTFKDKKKGGTQ